MHKKDFLSPWHHWSEYQKGIIAFLVLFILLLATTLFVQVSTMGTAGSMGEVGRVRCRGEHFFSKVDSDVPVNTHTKVRCSSGAPLRIPLLIDGIQIEADLAVTDADRVKGLSGRAAIGPNEGMLFVFEEPGRYGFWMKDMLFPLDIVWVNAEGKIVHIQKNAPPSTDPELYLPNVEALYVVEVPAGFTVVNGIEVGDYVTFPEETQI